MTCRELADFLGAYVAGELDPDARAAFDHHLVLCPNCVRYVAQYRRSIDLARDAFSDATAEIPEDVPQDLVDAILSARRRRP